MAERLDYNADIDFDHPWLDWSDLLAHDPKALTQILAGVPRAQGADGVLRALAIHDWLAKIAYPGLLLKTAFDDDGFPVETAEKLPLVLVEVSQEDLATRPERITQWKEVVALGGVDHANIQGVQWLDLDGAVDIDALREAYAPTLSRWQQQIEDAFAAWVRRTPTDLMLVVSLASGSREVGAWDLMPEALTFPVDDRASLIQTATGPAHSRLLSMLRERYPSDIPADKDVAMSVYLRAPSAGRLAEMERRRIDQDTASAGAMTPRVRL